MTNDVPENWAAPIAGEYPEMGAFARLLEEIGRESDRGVVLIMAGFLEQQLKELLAGYFVETTSASTLLEDPFAPLSTFASRIHASHALGLVTDDEYHDLNIIRKIRNAFAHLVDVSFEDQGVKDRCKTFKLSVQPFHDEEEGPIQPETRNKFTAPALSLILTLWHRVREVRDHRLQIVAWKQMSSKPEIWPAGRISEA